MFGVSVSLGAKGDVLEEDIVEGGAEGDFLGRGGAAPPYPSHLRPVLVHRVHAGLVSSHFTRRILVHRKFVVRIIP